MQREHNAKDTFECWIVWIQLNKQRMEGKQWTGCAHVDWMRNISKQVLLLGASLPAATACHTPEDPIVPVLTSSSSFMLLVRNPPPSPRLPTTAIACASLIGFHALLPGFQPLDALLLNPLMHCSQ